MSERNKVVPDSMLSKEFLSQFKTEADPQTASLTSIGKDA